MVGVNDELFFIEKVAGRAGYINNSLRDPAVITGSTAAAATGTFSVTSSAALLGSISDTARVTDARVTYELNATAGNTLSVESGMTTTGSSAQMGTDTALLPTTTTAPLRTSRVRASATGGVGTRGKQYQMKITEAGTPGNTKRIAVHEIDINVRKPRVDSA
jgi:hypothetical protein